jgi:hypothetical protein
MKASHLRGLGPDWIDGLFWYWEVPLQSVQSPAGAALLR